MKSGLRRTSAPDCKCMDLDQANAANTDSPGNRGGIENTGHLWNDAIAQKPIAIA